MPTVDIFGITQVEASDEQADAVTTMAGTDNEDNNHGIVDSILDIPADALNASTGTGENLGWFGVIDRNLDYRVLTGEMDADSDEWAEPNDQTTGLSGLFAATGQQAGAAAEDTAGGLWTVLKQSPVLLVGAIVAAAVLLRPYAGAVT